MASEFYKILSRLCQQNNVQTVGRGVRSSTRSVGSCIRNTAVRSRFMIELNGDNQKSVLWDTRAPPALRHRAFFRSRLNTQMSVAICLARSYGLRHAHVSVDVESFSENMHKMSMILYSKLSETTKNVCHKNVVVITTQKPSST